MWISLKFEIKLLLLNAFFAYFIHGGSAHCGYMSLKLMCPLSFCCLSAACHLTPQKPPKCLKWSMMGFRVAKDIRKNVTLRCMLRLGKQLALKQSIHNCSDLHSSLQLLYTEGKNHLAMSQSSHPAHVGATNTFCFGLRPGFLCLWDASLAG